jgi:hypothetical protein
VEAGSREPIKHYHIATGNTIDGLKVEVDLHLKLGWNLWGAMVPTQHALSQTAPIIYVTEYTQTLVFRGDIIPPKEKK